MNIKIINIVNVNLYIISNITLYEYINIIRDIYHSILFVCINYSLRYSSIINAYYAKALL